MSATVITIRWIDSEVKEHSFQVVGGGAVIPQLGSSLQIYVNREKLLHGRVVSLTYSYEEADHSEVTFVDIAVEREL